MSFAFFTQVSEYAITNREVNKAALMYRGVGAAEAAPAGSITGFYAAPAIPAYIGTDPRMPANYLSIPGYWFGIGGNVVGERYRPLTRAQVNAISALPYISLADTRYMTAGISEDYYRLDDGRFFYNYAARCVVEATIKELRFGGTAQEASSSNYVVSLEDCVFLAGNCQYVVDHDGILDFTASRNTDDIVYSHTRNGWTDRVAAINIDYPYDDEYLKSLKPGDRYIFVLRFEPLLGPPRFYLGDHMVNYWCPAIWPVESAPDNYMGLDDYSPLREIIEITDSDAHTLDMVYTAEMNSIMRFSEGTMSILDGRALTREDSLFPENWENSAAPCVINRKFAEAYGLGVGDSMKLKLGTELFEQYKPLGAVASARERYSPPGEAVTLEIVGIYTDNDNGNRQKASPHWNYSINTVFVPKSLFPVDENDIPDHLFTPPEFSFMVDNAWDFPAFTAAAGQLFDESGLKLMFNDKGWPDIAASFSVAKRLSIISIIVFSAAVIAATGFTVYLFIGRKKKEYAIMRALGIQRKKASRTLLLPLMLIAVISILVGSGAAWIYTVKTVAQSNALLSLQAFVVKTSIPAGVVFGCVFAELLLTMLFALMMLKLIGAQSPLALLQGGNSGAERRAKGGKRGAGDAKHSIGNSDVNADNYRELQKSTVQNIESNTNSLGAQPSTLQTSRNDASLSLNSKKGVGFVPRYIWKHVRRSARKSMLALLLAALLLCAVCQLLLMRRSYYDTYINSSVTVRLVGEFQLSTVRKIAESELSADPYYEAADIAYVGLAKTDLVFTNNISRYTGDDTEIIYTDGFDETSIYTSSDFIIAGRDFLEDNDLQPGDTVLICSRRIYENIIGDYLDRAVTLHPDSVVDEAFAIKLYADKISQAVRARSQQFKIAGVFSTQSGKCDTMLFSPGILYVPWAGFSMTVNYAEYTVADNESIDEFREFCEETIGGGVIGNTDLNIDTSKVENIRNTLRLLDALYPIVLSAALLIGAFICSLTILQSSKETAILRVIGATKMRSRLILSLEQALLSVAGLAVGVCVMLIVRKQEAAATSGNLAIFALMYFAAILASAAVCSTLVTRRSALELLQTKE